MKKLTQEDKLSDIDFPLFPALEALDKKDYSWYDKLTQEQKKGFVSFMLTHWMSAVKGNADLQRYYLQSVNHNSNKHLFHENILNHDKLQWLMLCAASPGMGKQFHKYVPHIKRKVSLLQEAAKVKDVKEYYKKIYPNADETLVSEVAQEYTRIQNRKFHLAQLFPNLKHDDIDTLNEIITDEQIKQYEKDLGY